MLRRNLLPLLLAVLPLGACGAETGLAFLGADAVSQAATGRTLQSHAMIALAGRDCPPLSALFGHENCGSNGDEDVTAVWPPPGYCYRTLGQVTCYAEPNPDMPPATRLYRE